MANQTILIIVVLLGSWGMALDNLMDVPVVAAQVDIVSQIPQKLGNTVALTVSPVAEFVMLFVFLTLFLFAFFAVFLCSDGERRDLVEAVMKKLPALQRQPGKPGATGR